MRMIKDIEEKKINLVITKDLSRLGREYIQTGQYTEVYFPSKGVRYIAINDNYDTLTSDTDIAPFRNIVNEMYARDTSKKIRSAFKAKMRAGEYIGNFAPYGYKKSENNKNQLIVDEEVSEIVKRIFDMTAKGTRKIDIARVLNAEKVMTPYAYRCLKHPYLNENLYSSRSEWTSSTIGKILTNVVYLGHLAQGKTNKVSFKSSETIQINKENWIITKNTHEAIINDELFEIVQRVRKGRSCPPQKGFSNVFSGIARCADCNKSMSTVGTRKKDVVYNLACGGYKLYGTKACTNHFIDYTTLYDIVLSAINEQIKMTEEETQDICEELKKENEDTKERVKHKKEISTVEKKIREIDSIIEKLYEDKFNNIITEDRFKKLVNKYEDEQEGLKNKSVKLNEKRESMERLKDLYDKFRELVKEYSEIKELNQEILFKLIDRIEIGQGEYVGTENGKIKRQSVKIYFRFIGESDKKEYKKW